MISTVESNSMKPGIYFDLPNEEYHGGEGINKGLLDVVERSAQHAKAAMDRVNDNAPEKGWRLIGSALHVLILEPEKFPEQYVCELTREDAPDAMDDRDELAGMVRDLNKDRLPKLPATGDKATVAARILAAYDEQTEETRISAEALSAMVAADLKAEVERLNASRTGLLPTSGNRQELAEILRANGLPVTLWADVRAKWDAENEGFTVLPVAIYRQLLAMRDAVMAHPAAAALFNDEGVAEASAYWTDETTGELCRCRPDWWLKRGILVDLKSTEDASEEAFAKSVQKYRYHVQHPWYFDGMTAAHDAGHFPEGWARPRAFVFVVVEKSEPYAVAVYKLGFEDVEIGRSQARDNLDTLAECRRTDTWPGYSDKITTLSLPDWYLRKNLHRLGGE